MSGLEVLVADRRRAALRAAADDRRARPAAAGGRALPRRATAASACSPPTSATAPPGGRFVEVRSGRRLAVGARGRLACAYARGARLLARRATAICGVCGGADGKRAGRPRAALPALRRAALPAQRPGGDRAGDPSPSRSTASAACSAARRAFRPASTRRSRASSSPANRWRRRCAARSYEEAGLELVAIDYRSLAALAVPGLADAGLSGAARERRAARSIPTSWSMPAGSRRAELLDPERRPVKLPNPDSIARHLIEDWLAEYA